MRSERVQRSVVSVRYKTMATEQETVGFDLSYQGLGEQEAQELKAAFDAITDTDKRLKKQKQLTTAVNAAANLSARLPLTDRLTILNGDPEDVVDLVLNLLGKYIAPLQRVVSRHVAKRQEERQVRAATQFQAIFRGSLARQSMSLIRRIQTMQSENQDADFSSLFDDANDLSSLTLEQLEKLEQEVLQIVSRHVLEQIQSQARAVQMATALGSGPATLASGATRKTYEDLRTAQKVLASVFGSDESAQSAAAADPLSDSGGTAVKRSAGRVVKKDGGGTADF